MATKKKAKKAPPAEVEETEAEVEETDEPEAEEETPEPPVKKSAAVTPANDALASITKKVDQVHGFIFPEAAKKKTAATPAKAGGGWGVLLLGLMLLALPVGALVALAAIGHKLQKQKALPANKPAPADIHQF